MSNQTKRHSQISNVRAQARNGAEADAEPGPPPWLDTHLTAEEEAELGRDSIRRDGSISSEEMRAFIESLPGYVPTRGQEGPTGGDA